MFDYMTAKESIIEFLIQNQGAFKGDVEGLRNTKKMWLRTIEPALRGDLDLQYEARIKQHIAFVTAGALGLPAEYVVVELETINLEDYLNA